MVTVPVYATPWFHRGRCQEWPFNDGDFLTFVGRHFRKKGNKTSLKLIVTSLVEAIYLLDRPRLEPLAATVAQPHKAVQPCAVIQGIPFDGGHFYPWVVRSNDAWWVGVPLHSSSLRIKMWWLN